MAINTENENGNNKNDVALLFTALCPGTTHLSGASVFPSIK